LSKINAEITRESINMDGKLLWIVMSVCLIALLAGKNSFVLYMHVYFYGS